MLRPLRLIPALFPMLLVAQAPATRDSSSAVMFQFSRFADLFGSRLVAAFASIPEQQYAYRPTPVQQTIGFIAQHLEDANYGLCGRFTSAKRPASPSDALPDSLKAKWPKDTLVARLDASLRYCDAALGQLTEFNSVQLASNLLAFETDLAEHYSQVAVYMRLLGLVPPSAIPPRQRTGIEVAPSVLLPFAGAYRVVAGLELVTTVSDGALSIRSVPGGSAVRLWPESATVFFVKDADLQVTFVRNSAGVVTGLVLHQYGRERAAAKVR